MDDALRKWMAMLFVMRKKSNKTKGLVPLVFFSDSDYE